MNILDPKEFFKSNKEYDVLIAGAGPAGCSAAMNLPDDMSVLIVDSSPFPRNKPCGGVLLERTQEFLNVNGMKPPENVFAEPKNLYMKILDIDNNLNIDVKRKFLNVRRDVFDKWLLELCGSNVDFLQRTKLENGSKTMNTFSSTIKTPLGSEKIKSKYLIDSTGALSFSKANSGIKNPVYVAYQEWLETKYQDYFGSMFCNKITDCYIWTIPKDGYTIVGTAFRPGGVMNKKIQNFKNFIKNELGFNKKPERIEAGVLPNGRRNDVALVKDDIMILGESAGLVSLSSGEGISFALRSGMFCAESIKKYPDNPTQYYKKMCNELLNEIERTTKIAEAYGNPQTRIELFRKMVRERI